VWTPRADPEPRTVRVGAARHTPQVQPHGRDATGLHGEEQALEHYCARGYRVLARNWRCRLGEIDLILASGDTVVFCEVKTRRGTAFGGPYDAVTWKKQRKLRQLAEAFLGSCALDPPAVRFDVASVTVADRGKASVHVFESAF
jgi:putative endonuclease